MMRTRRAATERALRLAVGLTLVVAFAGCTVPQDETSFQFPDTQDPGAALGKACDFGTPCPAELQCRIPSECRPDPDYVGDRDQTAVGQGCDNDASCPTGFVCTEVVEKGVCMLPCASDDDCPDPGSCWLAKGPTKDWCVPEGGLVSAACVFENDCHPGLACENRASTGYCTRRCGPGEPCPAGMGAICTTLSGGFGNVCLLRCGEGYATCRDAVTCTQAGSSNVYVCFPSF